MKLTTKDICLTAIGIALFVVLSLCLQVPVFENYYLCLGYVAMLLWCYYFGTAGGTAVGVLGVVLYCLLISGLRGMPGWAAGNLVMGIMVGEACRLTRGMKNRLLRHLVIVCVIVLSAAIGILGVKSLVEMLLYSQPILLRAAKNIYAFVADVVVLIAALPICGLLGNTLRKLYPEKVQ